MLEWQKLGNIFDPAKYQDRTWLKEFAQSPCTLEFDHFIRVYFCSRPPASPEGYYKSFLSFVDLDRENLLNVLRVCSEPILSLGSYGTFDEFGTYPVSVIRNGSEVRVYYAGLTRCESVPFNASIGVAVSRDNGESFSRLGEGPVLSYCPDEPFLLGSPRIRRFNGKWYLWYVSGKAWVDLNGKPEPVYKIRMASSDNGLDWTRHGKYLLEDRLGIHECQACPDVMFKDGRYHMFFSYRDIHNYRGKEGGYRIGYASSEDMVTWSRRDEIAGMAVSDSGWDDEMVNYPHVFQLDGEIYMLYQGNGMGRTGFGLARLKGPQNWSQL